MPGKNVNLLDQNLIYKVTQKYNDSLKFDPSEPKMAFTTRDPVRNGKSFTSVTPVALLLIFREKLTAVLLFIVCFIKFDCMETY